jgi:hypothetical protein
MNREELRERLTQLHSELRQLPSVGDGERELLRELERDIQGLLTPGGEREPDYTGFGERLKTGVELFEASHPRATMLMGQLIDTLTKMGI